MKRLILSAIILSTLITTVYAEEFIVTQYVKPNGNLVVTQTSKNGDYTYSREFVPGEKIVMPTERINMTDEEVNELRDSCIQDVLAERQKEFNRPIVSQAPQEKDSDVDGNVNILSVLGF